MSILNDTLKSLDERNQTEDFGLPPTVQVNQKIAFCIANPIKYSAEFQCMQIL